MQVLRPVSSHPAQGDEASLMSFSAAGLEGKCEIRARTGWAGAAGASQSREVVPGGHRRLTLLQHPFPAVKCFVFC